MAGTEIENDKELQRQMAISAFLSSPIFKEFVHDLEQMIVGANSDIDNIQKSHVDEKKLADLNFKLGFRKGLVSASLVLEGYKEELER